MDNMKFIDIEHNTLPLFYHYEKQSENVKTKGTVYK